MGNQTQLPSLLTTLCSEARSQQTRHQRRYSTESNSARRSKFWHKILIPRRKLSTTQCACCSSWASSPSRSSTLGTRSPPRHTQPSRRLFMRHTLIASRPCSSATRREHKDMLQTSIKICTIFWMGGTILTAGQKELWQRKLCRSCRQRR